MVLLLVLSMPVLFLAQLTLPDGGLSLAFRPSSIWNGQWWPGLLTSMFLHFDWAHVAMNAVGALAFGAPVARLLGGGRGVVGEADGLGSVGACRHASQPTIGRPEENLSLFPGFAMGAVPAWPSHTPHQEVLPACPEALLSPPRSRPR